MNTVIMRDGTKYEQVFQIDDQGNDRRLLFMLVDGEEQTVEVVWADVSCFPRA